MGRIKEIVIDADHPAALARFWAAAAEGYRVRDYDAGEIARLAALGLTPETDPSVMVDGAGPTLCFQLRTGPRPERNRIHFDLSTADRAGEIARLIALGAKIWKETEAFTVLRDPEGNQFCVVGAD
ncbi:MAG: VOC family protein [Devosia sp.]